jgi:hypothetical protein
MHAGSSKVAPRRKTSERTIRTQLFFRQSAILGPAAFRETVRKNPKMMQKEEPEEATPRDETLSTSSGLPINGRMTEQRRARE